MDNAKQVEKYTIEEYESISKETDTELINGIIYDITPPMRIHQKILTGLLFEIQQYIKQNKGGCEVYFIKFMV